MKYLFYDAESIDIKHKCSFTFGYVITDENFNILKPKEDIVFNPDMPVENWDWRAYRELSLKDFYPQKKIQTAKNFQHYYDKIKKLFTDDTLCIGFETNEDVKYLLVNCLKYNLEPINFKYIDIRDVLKYLTGNKPNSLVIEYIRYLHKIENDAHTSDTDAEMTMLVLRELLKKYKKNLVDILNSNENFIAESKDFVYGFKDNLFDLKNPRESKYEKVNGIRVRKVKEGQEDWISKGSLNDILFIRFLENVKPNEEIEQVFKDKKISISLNYEMYYFQNMLKIVQMITNAGGIYVKKGSLADIFVKQPNDILDENGNLRFCTKYNHVMEAIENEGKNIEILEFDDFLSNLYITKEELDSLPKIDVEYLNDEKYSNKTKMA